MENFQDVRCAMVEDIWFLHDNRNICTNSSVYFSQKEKQKGKQERGEIINLFRKDSEPHSSNLHNKPQNVNINFCIDFSVICMYVCICWKLYFWICLQSCFRIILHIDILSIQLFAILIVCICRDIVFP